MPRAPTLAISVRASSSSSAVATPATAYERIFASTSKATCPARHIISMSRLLLMTIKLGRSMLSNFRTGSPSVLPALDAFALGPITAEEAAVVSHEQIGLDALHHVQRHRHDDQQAGSAEKAADLDGNVHPGLRGHGDDGDDAQKRRADVGDAHHDFFKIIRRALPGPQAGNEAAVIAELVGHLLGLELHGRPEVGEEVEHRAFTENIDVSPVAELIAEPTDAAAEKLGQRRRLGIGSDPQPLEPAERDAGKKHQ